MKKIQLGFLRLIAAAIALFAATVSLSASADTLTFGTSACLDAATLRRIRYNGSDVHQDDEGYLRTGRCGGFVMIVY